MGAGGDQCGPVDKKDQELGPIEEAKGQNSSIQ
jgi:hypothetical protein